MSNDEREWLETDGLGGFASGTVCGERTRRYHALLLTARTPPTDRFVLVNGLEAMVTTEQGTFPLSRQRYLPNVIHPHGDRSLESFADDPWPQWTYRLPDGTRLLFDLFIPSGYSATILRWRLGEPASSPVSLMVRLLLSGRDYHALHHKNPDFHFGTERHNDALIWRPYSNLPGIHCLHNGTFTSDPLWYRQFLYEREAERGLDGTEDLASPGPIHFDLSRTPALCAITAEGAHAVVLPHHGSIEEFVNQLEKSERTRRSRFSSRLQRSADQFLVQRGTGKTVVAGYPWFTDWGRDTFISLRGLCLSTGRTDLAGEILEAWAGTVSEGMLPNRFPDHGEPEYNSVDASLWFVVAVWEYLLTVEQSGRRVDPDMRAALVDAIQAILSGYSHGTRYGIQQDHDGLLKCGQEGIQLTWMDARVGDWIVTPRIGKPVEVQALWINALWIGCQFSSAWRDAYHSAVKAFPVRFWNADAGCLFDVIDSDHRPGAVDPSIRPNQIFAVGGLPRSILPVDRARQVLDVVQSRLLTPLGLRTLAPDNPAYEPHYVGDARQRDGAYHQGTAWPWLTGAFVEAWVRVHGQEPSVRKEARQKFLQPILDRLDEYGLGHVCEIADGEPTETSSGPRQIPRGCPFQAWSLAELLRSEAFLQRDIPETVSGDTLPAEAGRSSQPESYR